MLSIFPALWNKKEHEILSRGKYVFSSSWQSFLYFEIHVTKAGVGQSRSKKFVTKP